jgi:hypothetical protein
VDVKPEFQEELWQRLRTIGPPVGARERVRQALQDRLEPPGRRRLGLVPRVVLVSLVVLVGGAAAIAGFYGWQAHGTPTPKAVRAQSTARASVVPAEPPAASPSPQRESSAVEPTHFQSPRTPGPARAREARHVRPREDLNTGTIDPVPQTEAPPTSQPSQTPPMQPSALAQQVAMYRQIAALEDDDAKLAGWRAMRDRWPSSTLRHEIDLNVVDTLGRLGREDESRREAKGFLQRFPGSPRAEEMRQLLGERPAPR